MQFSNRDGFISKCDFCDVSIYRTAIYHSPMFCRRRVHVLRIPALIAKPESDCRKASSPMSLARRAELWTVRLMLNGCGKNVVFTCSMAQPSRCPIRRRTNAIIRKLARKSQG